jgi:hypothetical protein
VRRDFLELVTVKRQLDLAERKKLEEEKKKKQLAAEALKNKLIQEK